MNTKLHKQNAAKIMFYFESYSSVKIQSIDYDQQKVKNDLKCKLWENCMPYFEA